MKRQRTKLNIFISSITWLSIYLLFVSLGFILGMVYQQLLFTQEVAKIISYTDININFNETKFVNEFKDNFIPEFKAVVNESLNCCSEDKRLPR